MDVRVTFPNGRVRVIPGYLETLKTATVLVFMQISSWTKLVITRLKFSSAQALTLRFKATLAPAKHASFKIAGLLLTVIVGRFLLSSL